MSTRIVFIRHSETEWNTENRIQGHRDVLLSETGLKQARKLNSRIKALRPDFAVSSDLQRSTETARFALQGTSLAPETTPLLRERNYGAWEGFSWPEVVKKFPGESSQFLNDPVGTTPPGGEPWLEMQERVFHEVARIAQDHPGKCIALFTHGGPIKAFVLKALGMDPVLWRRILTRNASLTTLDLASNGWRLVGFNDICHLNELEEKGEPIG